MTRAYRSTTRDERARATRRTVVAAAAGLSSLVVGRVARRELAARIEAIEAGVGSAGPEEAGSVRGELALLRRAMGV